MAPPRYDDVSSQAVRFDAIAGQLAQISGQLTVALELLRGLRDVEPEPKEEKKHGAMLAAFLDPRVILALVALAIISASVAIVALVLTGNGAAVADLAKGLKG
jgi:hypothetical protein